MSDKRQQAKLNRNKGKEAMKKAGMDQAQWTAKHDPFRDLKGQERHNKIRSTRCRKPQQF